MLRLLIQLISQCCSHQLSSHLYWYYTDSTLSSSLVYILIKTASERVLSACYPLLLYYPDLLFSCIKPKPPQLSSSWLQALITQSISGQIKTTRANQLHFEDFPQHEQQLKQSLSLGGLNVVAKMKVLGFGAQMVLHKN